MIECLDLAADALHVAEAAAHTLAEFLLRARTGGQRLPEEYDILPPAEVLHAPADGGNGCTVAGDFEGMNIPSSPVPAEPAEFEEGVL